VYLLFVYLKSEHMALTPAQKEQLQSLVRVFKTER
jgi:hypothetical protein